VYIVALIGKDFRTVVHQAGIICAFVVLDVFLRKRLDEP